MRKDYVRWNQSFDYNRGFEKSIHLADWWLLHLKEICTCVQSIDRTKKCIYEDGRKDYGLASHQSSHFNFVNLEQRENNVQAKVTLEILLNNWTDYLGAVWMLRHDALADEGMELALKANTPPFFKEEPIIVQAFEVTLEVRINDIERTIKSHI
jgi:hypothetical protein